jgi:hypothetical protein
MSVTTASRLGYKQRFILGVTLASSQYTGGTDVKFVKEVKVDDNVASLDSTTRNCNGFKGKAPGLRELKYTFKYMVDDNDTSGQLSTFMAAFCAKTTVTVAAVDPNGQNGTAAEMFVQQANTNENNEQLVEIDFVLEPHYAAAIPPQDITTNS